MSNQETQQKAPISDQVETHSYKDIEEAIQKAIDTETSKGKVAEIKSIKSA